MLHQNQNIFSEVEGLDRNEMGGLKEAWGGGKR
jgi:hypothetical protein